MPTPSLPARSGRTAVVGAALSAAVAFGTGAVPFGVQPTAAAAPASAPASAVTADTDVWAAERITAMRDPGSSRVWIDPGFRLVTGTSDLEVRSVRRAYDSPIETTWRRGDATGTLPLGTQRNLSGLTGFATVEVRDAAGRLLVTKQAKTCLGGWGAARSRPDAAPTSEFPMQGCSANPYALGTVQGIPAGWSTPIMTTGIQARLERGTYEITFRVAPTYADAFGLPASERTRTSKLIVKNYSLHGGGRGAAGGDAPESTGLAEPAAAPPQGAPTDPTTPGPRPDLRSLPAWGISLNPKGTQLRFSATVWNAGNTPLVLDGFRRSRSGVMDTYQYFFDADGNQTGYSPVGTMEFHGANHQHWHFQDFARYQLLRPDGSVAVTSKKVSFCLANTDVVDYTVPGADFSPENTDLSTACGDSSASSIREVLAAGSGDTYEQFRAGQSFNLKNLRRGWYYISVEANPDRNLVESDVSNNSSLRRVWIGGKPGARAIKVPQVGLVVERSAPIEGGGEEHGEIHSH